MFMNKKIFHIVLLALFPFTLWAQQIGSWRMHFRGSRSIDLAYSDTKLLSADEKALLIYHFSDNTIQALDKTNALSDIGISSIAYNQATKTFIVVYHSSNIDLISDDLVVNNMPDIKNKITATSKSINAIFSYNKKAFLATDLGIVVLNIENKEIEDTYIIGVGGNPEPIIDIAIANDTIYALTNSLNLKTASLNSNNLLDYNNWAGFGAYPGLNVNYIETFNNDLYAILDKKKLVKYSNGNWEIIYQNNNNELATLIASEKLTSIYNKDSAGMSIPYILTLDKDNTIDSVAIQQQTLDAKKAIYTNSNSLYIADYAWGIIDFFKNSRIFEANKPSSSAVYAINNSKDKVFVAPGLVNSNIDAQWNADGFFYFKNNNWHNINAYTNTALQGILNFLDIEENLSDKKIYGATTKGLVEIDGQNVQVFDTSNSILGNDGFSSSVYITGIEFDSKGNLWMVNSRTTIPLKVKTKDNEWYQFPLSFGGNKKYNHFLVDKNDQKWVSLGGSGISVFPAVKDFANAHALTAVSLNGLPNNYVGAMAEDKDGAVWVGTGKGIAVYDCPQKIFESGSSNCRTARRIKSTLDDYTEYLFDTDIVYAIAVDGANRKWVGTSSGAWLLNETGEKLIHSFNTDNSPLPSNEVTSIGIHPQTGEVFFGTPQGLASYMSDATEPAENISGIKAFPNPVHPNYNGSISVTGLVENSFIKITDIAGVLIADGYALGGKFVWNGKDINGVRAKTGVYLVFSSDNKSKNKAVAKIVFIN